MGQISSLFAHKVVDIAVDGCDAMRRNLLCSVGVDPEASIDPKHMIPSEAYYDLCERSIRASALGPALSVHVGASMRCEDYGAFGLAWKSAPDLRKSWARTERYWRVLTSVSMYRVEEEENRTRLILDRAGERRLGLRLSNEQTIVANVQISREVSTVPINPCAVFFKHAAPSDISAHEDYFGCPVVFSAQYDALEVSRAAIEAPNQLGDESISRFFDTHLDAELAALADDGGLDHRVRAQVAQALSGGMPTISEVGAQLGMSGRTLQRRLAERGLTFQGVVDDARRELVERLLARSDYSLMEVAFLTGFSEQSALNRAFKRWSGQTPRSYRLNAHVTLGGNAK